MGHLRALRSCNKVSPPQSLRSASNMRSEGDAAMDSAIIDEILEELSSALQRVEAQSTAILELINRRRICLYRRSKSPPCRKKRDKGGATCVESIYGQG